MNRYGWRKELETVLMQVLNDGAYKKVKEYIDNECV